jgi:ABC-type nitrate/sulfonate/bicarbonate transport system substrate-binding protein
VTHALDLGFVALTDAAPLIVARERGFFVEDGLDVTLHREASWATIRDKVAAGLYQGAHMLAPLAIATNLGVGSEPAPLIVSMSLNAHGAAIGVSASLAGEMSGAGGSALKTAVETRRARGGPVISFAVVFPYSMHNYMLRYWIASAGIDPDRDIRIVVAPPTAIAARLRAGEIDGFCVGAPWSAVCEAEGRAQVILEAGEFWNGGPDKVLGLSQPWAERETSAALAVTRALARAAVWADAPDNRAELAQMLAQPGVVNAPADLIARALMPGSAALRFANHTALFPWRSHAAWIVSQMMRWGQVGRDVDVARALDCYRPDLFRTACADAGISAPLQDSKIEGAHAAAWAITGSRGPIPMTADKLPDDGSFDPDSVATYAAGFDITRLTG